jgi:hypothetical protein
MIFKVYTSIWIARANYLTLIILKDLWVNYFGKNHKNKQSIDAKVHSFLKTFMAKLLNIYFKVLTKYLNSEKLELLIKMDHSNIDYCLLGENYNKNG